MGKTVFISYAASDQDWPVEAVEALATELRDAGHDVRFDEWEDRDKPKKSDDDWRNWMYACIKDSHRILCLASRKYRKLSLRDDPSVPAGRGVAFESIELENILYQQKQNNPDLIWLVSPSSGFDPADVIPVRLAGRCPTYCLDKELVRLVRDVGLNDLRNAVSVSSPDVAPESALARLKVRLYLRAKGALSLAKDFREALHARQIEQGKPIRSGNEDSVIAALSAYDDPQDILFEVQGALQRIAIRSDSSAKDTIVPAAVAIYLWACLRWIEMEVQSDFLPQGQLLNLPKASRVAVALFCEAMLDGDLRLSRSDSSAEHPDHWDVTHLPEGGPDGTLVELERHVYLRGNTFGMRRLEKIEQGNGPGADEWEDFRQEVQRIQKVEFRMPRIVLHDCDQHLLLRDDVAVDLCGKTGLQVLRATVMPTEPLRQFMRKLDKRGYDLATEIDDARLRGTKAGPVQ